MKDLLLRLILVFAAVVTVFWLSRFRLRLRMNWFGVILISILHEYGCGSDCSSLTEL